MAGNGHGYFDLDSLFLATNPTIDRNDISMWPRLRGMSATMQAKQVPMPLFL